MFKMVLNVFRVHVVNASSLVEHVVDDDPLVVHVVNGDPLAQPADVASVHSRARPGGRGSAVPEEDYISNF